MSAIGPRIPRGLTALAASAAASPLEQIVIGGRQYRVDAISPKDMILVKMICTAIAQGELSGTALNLVCGLSVLALLAKHHPDLTLADVIPHITNEVFHPAGVEVARQLIKARGMAIN